MSIGSLAKIKQFFGTLEDSKEKEDLYKEMLVMTLARATRADLVTDDREVSKVQDILCATLGADVSAKDIRVAASSELYETAPIEKYLATVGPKIDADQRQAIIRALIDVFKADGRVSDSECDFFDMVASSLKLTPAELAGLR
ncbi:MAG: TerB family tellurite resistance protein [Pseudomonadales bacterium]